MTATHQPLALMKILLAYTGESIYDSDKVMGKAAAGKGLRRRDASSGSLTGPVIHQFDPSLAQSTFRGVVRVAN